MSAPDTTSAPVLEDAAQAFVEATAKPPFLFDLPVAEGRAAVDTAQDGDFPDPAATTENLTIDGGPAGDVHLTIYRPAGSVGVLPVVLYTHGAGWVFGDVHTHDRLVRELTTRAEAATVFTSYSLSPEARYPAAIEEIYAVLEWIAGGGGEHDLDGGRIAVAGDSVGGNMTAAITLMTKQRGGSGSGTSTQPTRRSTPRSPPPRCGRAPMTWQAWRRRWLSTARPTCFATRARPTPRTCARPGSRSLRSATTARSTTSSC